MSGSAPIQARVSPGNLRDIGIVNWVVAYASGRVSGTSDPLNLFRVLGRAKGLSHGWLHFAGRMMPGGKLPRTDTELVINRVAYLADCAYEVAHHRAMGKRVGLTDAELDRVSEGPDAHGWTPRQATLLTAVDELDATGDLSDDTWERVRSELDERETIEFVMLTAHYRMLATTITTLRVPLDTHR